MNKKYQYTPINIRKQGAPIVDYAYIERKSDEIALVVVNMKSKRCVIKYIFGSLYDTPPLVVVEANEQSLHLNLGFNRNEQTEIELSDFNGWSILAKDEGRYSLYLCLIKNENEGD